MRTSRTRLRSIALLVAGAALATPASASLAAEPAGDDQAAGSTRWLSRPLEGTMPNGTSGHASVSADGRWVAFASRASNLVPDDDNAAADVFLYDRKTEKLVLISRNLDGAPADDTSDDPTISADGRYVAFASFAGDLVPEGADTRHSVYRYDRTTGEIVLVDRALDGGASNGIAQHPGLSADGQVVVYQSSGDDLVGADDNDAVDIFVTDLASRDTVLVSRTPTGEAARGLSNGPTISADGTQVAFQSDAADLAKGDRNGRIDVFHADLGSGTVSLISRNARGRAVKRGASLPALSANGSTLVFHSRAATFAPGDTNGKADVYAYDVATAKIVRVSSTPDGLAGDAPSWYPEVSGDGNVVAFTTSARNLLEIPNPGRQSVVALANLSDGTVRLGSISTDGGIPGGPSWDGVLSEDGSSLAFTSEARDLVDGDPPFGTNVYLSRLR